MSLQSERIQLLMQRLSLTEMARGYDALAKLAPILSHHKKDPLENSPFDAKSFT